MVQVKDLSLGGNIVIFMSCTIKTKVFPLWEKTMQ